MSTQLINCNLTGYLTHPGCVTIISVADLLLDATRAIPFTLYVVRAANLLHMRRFWSTDGTQINSDFYHFLILSVTICVYLWTAFWLRLCHFMVYE